MTNLINQLSNWISSPVFDSVIVKYVGVVLMALLGILFCLYGFKMVRGISTVIGFLIGGAVGYAVAQTMNLTQPVSIIVPVALGIVFALLGFFVRRLGIFVSIFCGVFSVVISLVDEYTRLDSTVLAIIALVAGVILAILCVVYLRPAIITVTAIMGGMMFSNEVFEHLIRIRLDGRIEMYIRLGVGALLAIIGIIYQFQTTKGMRGPKPPRPRRGEEPEPR